MVVYHVVLKGMIILKLIPMADHTLEDVDKTIRVFSEIKLKLIEGHYKQEIEITV